MISRDRFYSAPEAWRLSHAPRELLYSDLESGELKAIRRGRRWLIPGAALIEWIETRKQNGPRSPSEGRSSISTTYTPAQEEVSREQ